MFMARKILYHKYLGKVTIDESTFQMERTNPDPTSMFVADCEGTYIEVSKALVKQTPWSETE